MDDDGNFVRTSTTDTFVMNFTPVISNDQSSDCENPTNSVPAEQLSSIQVQPNADELIANLSERVDSENSANTCASADEAPNFEDHLHSTEEAVAPEISTCDTALSDETADAGSSRASPLRLEAASNDAPSFVGDISNENNLIDSVANDLSDHSSAFSNCTDFGKPDYSVGFIENLSKIEKSNSLMASDLISSETMNDFFDEMYDMNYANHYRRRKSNETSDLTPSSYCTNEIDGNLRDQDWSVSTLESDSCRQLVDQSTNKSATIKSNLKRFGEMDQYKDYLPCKKARKGITFDSVSVYYFPRTQGFTCIPSQGGSTLGMSWNHSHIRKFSLGEHAAEQRKAHRQLCSQQLDSTRSWNESSNISSEDSDSDEIASDSEVDYENYNFLQPIPTRERRAMLREAGIHKIDSREKDECRNIRLSREFCGCTCQIYCDPESCVCAQAGIKCQVDRMNFPCSCTRDGCANENGRVEFNPVRVRTHFMHTLMRLDGEKKKEEEEEHNHRLLFGELDAMPQLSPYPASALAPSSSASDGGGGDCGANLLTSFAYHPNSSVAYYGQPPVQQSLQPPSLYDVASPTTVAASESAHLAHPAFGYDGGHPYAPVDDDSSYGQPGSVSGSLAVLGENGSASLAAGYALSGEQCMRLAAAGYEEVGAALAEMQQPQASGFDDVAGCATTAAAYGGDDDAESFMRFAVEDEAKERSLECQSEGETLDTSTETSEEAKKEEESDLENFGDLIKKTMVESVIA